MSEEQKKAHAQAPDAKEVEALKANSKATIERAPSSSAEIETYVEETIRSAEISSRVVD